VIFISLPLDGAGGEAGDELARQQQVGGDHRDGEMVTLAK
jgi:hypothetical protein